MSSYLNGFTQNVSSFMSANISPLLQKINCLFQEKKYNEITDVALCSILFFAGLLLSFKSKGLLYKSIGMVASATTAMCIYELYILNAFKCPS